MEINKVQWRMIAKGEKLPCDSFLMKKDGTMTSMVTSAGVTVGQDAYYLPVEELMSFPKEESEDERIRKELIAEVKEQIDCIPVPDCRDKEDEKALKQLNKRLAWLEKQGEQKPDDKKGMNLDEDEMTPFQKKVFCIIDTTIEEEQGLKQVCDELLRLAHDEIMQDTAWSEEDEKMKRTIISDGIRGAELDTRQINWLKFLKDRVQPKQEWSEEDIKALNRISTILVDASEVKNWWKEYRLIEKDEMIRLTTFLKSLRPQSQWKPSDEQMEALKYSTYCPNEQMSKVLFELYQDLKNL